jgi:WD40 repeat protein
MIRTRCACWVGLMLTLTVGCTKRDTPSPGAASTGGGSPGPSASLSTPGKDSSPGPTPTLSGKGKQPGPEDSLQVKKQRYNIPNVVNVREFVFSPSGTLLAWADDTKKVHLWDVAANKRKGEKLIEEKLIDPMAFSPDGKTVALGSGHGPIYLWDVETLEIKTLPGHANNVNGVAFAGNDRLVSGGLDKSLKVWDLAKAKDVKTIPLPATVTEMSCSADGKLAALRLYNVDQPKLWDLETGKESMHKLPADTKAKGVVLSPDGKTLAVIVPGGEVLLWDVEGGSLRKKLTGKAKNDIYLVRFSADGKTLAWAGFDSVRVWDVATGKLRAEMPFASANRVALSGDGNVLATTSGQSISVWDVPAAK